jgi:hypothetical protein
MKVSSRSLLAPLCVLLLVGCQKAEPSDDPDDSADDGADDGADTGNPDDDGKDDSADDQDPPDEPDDPEPPSCSGDPCSILDQCGCAADQACDLDPARFAEGTGMCRATTEAGTETTSCTTPDQCATGYGCIGGQCRAYCDAADDCGGNRCDNDLVYVHNGVTTPIPGVKGCSKTCRLDLTPLDSGCPNDPAIGCRLQADDDGTYTDCRRAAATGGKKFADCQADGDCARGFGCFTFLGDDFFPVDECLQICVRKVDGVAAVNTCPGTACGAVDGMTVDGVEYGVCL